MLGFFRRCYMPSMVNQITYPHSPLIKTLQSLSMLDSGLPHSRFVATVGQFIDFSEAFSLADFLGKVPNIAPKIAPKIASTKTPTINPPTSEESTTIQANAAEKAQADYLQVRGEVLALIMGSFVSEKEQANNDSANSPSNTEPQAFTAVPSALRVPQIGDDGFNAADNGLSAYLRFYQLYQSEMESRILPLHKRIRQQLTQQSSSLAQLAALDAKLGDILTSYSRKSLRAITTLLSQRFHYLGFDGVDSQTETNQTQTNEIQSKHLENTTSNSDNAHLNNHLQPFLNEVKSIMLAELDTRLQPTLGLIEALSIELSVKKEEENT